MNMQTIILEIPAEILYYAKIPQKNLVKELKKELALQLYRDGLLSFKNCCMLAEMDKVEFHFLLGEKKIPRQYDIEDYQKDLENIKKLDLI